MNLRDRLLGPLAAHPIAAPVLAGALARLCAALLGMGFHARDDYFHVLLPALRWEADAGFDWDASGLPGAGLRSHLFPRVVQLLVHASRALGVTEPETLLSLLHLALGAYSLLVIPGLYLLGRELLSKRGARLLAWLGALHFVMPYAGTRLLLEALAMPPLVLGLWACCSPRMARIALGGLLVGLACWFRYQVGAAALGLAAVVAVVGWREAGARAALLRTLALAGGGAAALAVQGCFDMMTTGGFLRPVLANLAYNLNPPESLTTSSAFTYVLTFIALTAPPATLVLLPAMLRASTRLLLVSVPFVAFVLLHSLVPHKEERFLLPALPLFLVLLAAVPEELAQARDGLLVRLRPFARPLVPWLVGIHAVLLVLAITSRSQENIRQALGDVRRDRTARGLVVMGPELPEFFLGDSTIATARTGKIDAVWLARTLEDLDRRGRSPNRFMAFQQDAAQLELLVHAVGYLCEPPATSRGYWLDRLVYRLNPEHNRRRSPILVWTCERPAVASLTP